MTGWTKMCREHAKTITNAHTATRPTAGRIEPHTRLAVVDLRLTAGLHRTPEATVTFSRTASSDRFAEIHRRTDDSDAETP